MKPESRLFATPSLFKNKFNGSGTAADLCRSVILTNTLFEEKEFKNQHFKLVCDQTTENLNKQKKIMFKKFRDIRKSFNLQNHKVNMQLSINNFQFDPDQIIQ
jgi:hypothetical protein